MSTNSTISVTLQDGDVDVRKSSSVTASLRKKVNDFIRRTYAIWKEQAAAETGLIASAEVVDEVVHCATAFHANEQGTVDMVEVKKDIPVDAINNTDVGYWRAAANLGSRHEQREMVLAGDVPQAVMDEIAQTNSHDLIAHYLYAFINFWPLILEHDNIWLACSFWYGYLCIVQPTIIVGESSKLFNIIRDVSPIKLFRPNLVEEELNSFIAAPFTLDTLRQITMPVPDLNIKQWEDCEMTHEEYINVLGLPVVQAYGPLSRHYALYIPRMDPYAPYVNRDISNQVIELQRYVRLMIELSAEVVQSAAPIPFDASREECLEEVRDRIMSEASEIGLLDQLDAAKTRLLLANQDFDGLP